MVAGGCIDSPPAAGRIAPSLTGSPTCHTFALKRFSRPGAGNEPVAGPREDNDVMIQLTSQAVTKVKQLLAAENKEGYGLRVAIQGGGCSGFQYGLTFENQQ